MRLVVKVGTSLIAPGGRIDTTRMRALVDQLDLSRHEYLIVSSGAIASGMTRLGLSRRPATVPLMQACAAVGQSLLMHTYEQLFFGKKVVAQLLLSSDDFTSPIRYRNLQNALHELLQLDVIPVVNENDSVSVRELVGAFDEEALYYPWTHPDPRVDRLYEDVLVAVKESLAEHESRRAIFSKVWKLARTACIEAYEATERDRLQLTEFSSRSPRTSIPHVSEPWFC